MTFDELELYKAIKAVRELIDRPRSSDWLIQAESREQLCRRVESLIPLKPERVQQILAAWETCGKKGAADQSKLEITILLAERFGAHCFWAGRVPGECSDDVHLDRLVPGAVEGIYEYANCVLSCGAHNTSRGKKSVEDYLRSHLQQG